MHQIQRWAGRAGQGLFDSIIVFENYPVERALREAGAGDGLRFADMRGASVTNYALALEVHTGDTLDIEYNYQCAQIGAPAAKALQRSMMHLLDEIGVDAGRCVAALDTVDAADRARLAAMGQAPEAAILARADFVHARIRMQARARPGAVAVRDDAGTLSYGEVAARAESLARRLIDLGAGPDVPVAVCLERSSAIVPALLGTLMSGAAYVPLDPAYPAARLAYMVRDSRAAIVLTTRALRARLPAEIPARVFLLDDLPPRAGRGRRHAAARGPASRPPGLRGLYLRLHRPTQGRRPDASSLVRPFRGGRRTLTASSPPIGSCTFPRSVSIGASNNGSCL